MSFERIRKIENELETGQLQNRGRSIIHDTEQSSRVGASWDSPQQQVVSDNDTSTAQRTNWFKKILIFSIIFACIGGVVFGFSFFLSPKNVSDKNVSVIVAARPNVDGGESFPVTVTVTNKNKVPMEFVKISLEYPLVQDGELSGLFQEKTIDTILPGEIKEVPFSVSLYGSANTSRIITARVSYRVPGSVALFESLATVETILRSSPVRLSLENNDQVFSNQEMSLVVKYTSQLKSNSPSSMFRIQYPVGFRFISAEPKPDTGNNTWKLGTLVPGNEGTITIKGFMSGILGEEKIFTGTLGSVTTNQDEFESIYGTVLGQTKIVSSFLAITLDGGTPSLGDKYILQNDGDNEFTLRYQNTQNTAITNAKISVILSGNIWNSTGLRAGTGFYNSDTNALTWTSDEVPGLGNIPPGGSGEIQFGVSDLSSIDSSGKIISRPELLIRASIEGISQSGQKLFADTLVKNTYTLATEPSIVTKLLSTQNPIKNTGTYPPMTGKESTYTVVWKLNNTISPLGQTVVTAKLPSWIRYTGNISPQSAKDFITYNETTRVVTWSPGTVAPGVGYSSNPLEVYFQVAIKPSTSQIGSAPAIIGPASLTGRDQNIGVPINISGSELTTASSGDGKGLITK
jgi:hypothetical protein